MTDADGEEAGYVLYDAYGRVLSNTLSAELEAALAGQGAVADPDVGLVYLGDGRWYDPALGRPLQPNPVGGPPTLPQALNRYAPTPWGPPGVGESYRSNALVYWAASQSLKIALGKGAQALYQPRFGSAVGWLSKTTGWARIQMQAEKRLIPRAFEHLAVTSSRRPRLFSPKGLVGLFTDRYNVETRAGRVWLADVNLSVSEASALNLRVLERETVDILRVNWKAAGLDLGLAIFLDIAFQVGQDWGNPYLTREQRVERAGWAGVGALASGGAGLAAEAGLVYIGVASGPAGWIAIGVAVSVDLVWNFWISPMIYEGRELSEERYLQPLGGVAP